MIDYEVKNRFTGAVQFTTQIDCAEDAPVSIKLGLAVRWAIKNKANLAGAYLEEANLAGANLARAYLAGAYLARAYLAGAYLAGADLAGANLARANLAGADLAGVDLEGADLEGANLAGANLARADLARANLAGATLTGCTGADMDSGKTPIQLYGLRWPVTITDTLMRIGCQQHTFAAWRDFSAAQIRLMDSGAPAFWTAHKATLFALIETTGHVG